MKKQVITCINLGMNRDIGISLLSEKTANYAFENHNIRITAVNDNTLYTVTNEKGTKFELTINGTFLGSCTLNDYIVIFTKDTTSNTDYIYRLEYDVVSATYKSNTLYEGYLNFDITHPIEAIGYYESLEVQKVYWVDGTNPNRFINIANDKNDVCPDYSSGNIYLFDFLGHINSIPDISITKNYSKAGTFQAGTIQYFATYYNKYGTETCIVWQSDLLYISMSDRGAKPDEVVSCAFDFTIDNLDTAYDYIRIYAAYRAGLNGTAEGRIVAELELGTNSNLSFSDYGINYQNYNADDIHYIGGLNIIANTIDYKLDTLFLGNIKLGQQEKDIEKLKIIFLSHHENNKLYENITIKECPYIEWYYKKVSDLNDSILQYTQQLNDSLELIAGFKYREFYRFAIQFMDDKAEWTSAIWVGDKYCDKQPVYNITNLNGEEEEGKYIACAKFTLLNMDNDDLSFIQSKYVAYRLLVAETNYSTRRILTQGVINPTMFNYKDREDNRPFSINSWIFRPRKGNVANRHYDMLATQESEYAEIQGIMTRKIPGKLNRDVGLDSTDSNYRDGYMLIFAPNYLAGCRLWYKLIYYNTNSCADFKQSNYSDILNIKEGQTLNSTILSGREAALAICKSNQCLKDGTTTDDIIPYHFSLYDIISDRLIKATTWKDIASKTISAISEDLKKAGKDVVISENMLPSAELYKQAWAVKGGDGVKTWTFIGLGVALAASIIASVFSFGAASPALGTVVATTVTLAATMKAMGLAAAAAASVVAAIGAGAGIATMAELYKYNENLKDIDKQLAIKGIYPILKDHTLGSRQEGADVANTLLAKTFFNWQIRDKNPFTLKPANNSLGSDSNFYAMGGRLTIADEKEEEKNSKKDAFYIDESIVSLNVPDINNISEFIKDSEAYNLNLIGTIPINNVATDYLIYAELGLSSTSLVISGLQYTKDFNDKEGLFNGFLYLDSKWPDKFSTEEDNKVYIQATAAVSAYKTFMWNRNTSLSLWVPGFEIRDVFGNVLTSPPAKPIKKIFANYKYSNTTNYYSDIYNIDTDGLVVYSSDLNLIDVINYNGDSKYYLGNIDSIIIPYEDYTLIADDNLNEFHKNEENVVDTQLKDIIPLKYKTSPHIVIPFKWTNTGNPTLLPLTSTESEVTLDSLYGDISNHEIYGIPNKRLSGQYTKDENPTIIEYYLLEYSKYELLPDTPTLEDKINILPDVIDWYTEAKSLYALLNKGDDWGIDSDVANKLFRDSTPTLFYYLGKGKVYLNGKLEDVDIQYGSIYGEVRIAERDTIIVEGNVDIATVIQEGVRFSNPEVEAGQTVIYIWPDGTEHNTPYEEPIKYIYGKTPSTWDEPFPYLFLGELVKKDFVYDDWYGGYSDYALQQVNWNVCSKIIPVSKNIENTWGDTYYQRWECLKTYPFSEQEVNGNVEVLSFMLESHINLDGRSDVNRGTYNLINLRPANSNLFNSVYNLQDNFFSYKVLDEKFEKSEFSNLIIWSLSKSNLDNIDKWTNISAVNTLSLDGKLGKITKIINVNDTLLAFQESGISTINYNLQTALTTYEGIPLQMGNTGKVTGYTKVTDDIGCSDKRTMCLSEAGLFFIDSNLKSLYLYTANKGISNISNTGGFGIWFKENLNDKFITNYDSMTSDLYISNDKYCLVYNTALNSFVSFMDYINTPIITNIQGRSIALNLTTDTLNLYTMFEGLYDIIYENPVLYSIEYRLNPSPYTDNLFTNYLYVADWTNPNTKSNDYKQFDTNRFDHFDTVEAWNEYQHGVLKADTGTGTGIRPIKTKFRIWRGDIPRDGDTKTKRVLKGDRMRNPWIHLKFTKENIDNTKMTFHNLNVIYYN